MPCNLFQAPTRSKLFSGPRLLRRVSFLAAGQAMSGTTNAKPRDDFAGPHRFATFRGLISSRHRDACRPVVTSFRVALSEVSSIGLPSIHNFTLHLALSAGIQVARLAPRPLPSAPVSRLGIILKHCVEVVAARSPQVHPQYGARTTARH